MNTEREDSRLTREDELSSGVAPVERDSSSESGREGDGSDGSRSAEAVPSESVAPPDDYLEVKARAAERDRFLDELKRTRADLENVQRRTRREQPQLERKGARRVLAEIVGVVDNFERALASLDSDGAGDRRETSGLAEGVRMIHGQLRDVLANHGVKEIAALGVTFDPEYHEAVTQEEVEDRPTGEIVEVLQRGYLHYEAVLRPAAVKVALNVADRKSSAEGETGGATDDSAGESSGVATERRSDVES